MRDFPFHVDLIGVADYEHPISIVIFKPTSFYMYKHDVHIKQLIMLPTGLSWFCDTAQPLPSGIIVSTVTLLPVQAMPSSLL